MRVNIDTTGRPMDTPAERRLIWGIVAFECQHIGHIEFAADAFKHAKEEDPPRSWPSDHPLSRPHLVKEPGWGMKLIGRATLWAIRIRIALKGKR